MPILSAATQGGHEAMNCAFGLLQSLCSYDIVNPPVFFSLGEAVGALGLIFAVYALKNSSWNIVFSIRNRFQRNLVWYLGGAGLAAVFMGAVIRELPLNFFASPFNSPLLYELIGFLFFIAAPTSLLVLARRKVGLFYPKRAHRFYGVLHNAISRPTSENIEVVVDLIGSNLEEICEALSKIARFPRRPSDEEAYEPSDEQKFAGSANAILTVILGDSKVANYIATGRLDFTLYLFEMLKKHNITNDHTRLGIEKLLEALFTNKSSHLYSQLDYRGMSLSANAYEELFSDPYFVSRFDPYSSAVRWGGGNLTSPYLTVYLKALRHSLQGYWANSCPNEMEENINRGLRQLGEYCKSLALFKFEKGKERQSLDSLGEIGMFLGHTYVWDYRDGLKKTDAISDYEKNATYHDYFSHSVNYAYSACLYEYIEALSMFDKNSKTEENIRLHAITATTEVIGVNANPADDLGGIRKALISLIWEKIASSPKLMSNEDGYFPTVLRTYISLVGLEVGSPTSVHSLERAKVITFLNDKIKPKILAGELMKNDRTTYEEALLPTNVKLNRTTGKFEYEMSRGSVQEMN